MSDAQDSSKSEFEFRAEVQQVLSLVINSLYTNSEIFLRELISNASDALDKARFLQLSRDDVTEQEGEPKIAIALDGEKKTLTIEDNGIGMTRDEVIENLGTVARSGTSDFVKRFSELSKEGDEANKALELIGQFGVGFYSVFMVASRVDVQTRSMLPDAEPVLWRSSGSGSFNVLEGEREHPGTTIVVHLKDEAASFSQPWRVKEIIKRYSDFVMFPIEVDGDVANTSSALWRAPKSSITPEQHAEFFKHLTGGRMGDEPLVTVHYAVDAPVQFAALVYVPERSSSDLLFFQKERPGLRLYARRVLIQDNCESLTPSYLRFLCGVVDSEDLPLNVSRETLQENREIKQIEQQITKQALKALEELAADSPERYGAFWKQFGQVFKEGLAIDWKNKDAIAKLCRFESLKSDPGKLLSLDDYLTAKPEAQKEIFYLTGPDRAQLEKSPHLEVFRKHDRDVLLLTDPIDEWVVKSLASYEEVPLKSIAHGDVDLGDVDSGDAGEEDEGAKKSIDAALEAIRKALADKVDEVRLSKRLTDTASCLVSKEGDPGANLERLMKLMDEGTHERKRILEVNGAHPLVRNLGTLAERDPGSSHLTTWSEMLYAQALLSEGVVADPAELVQRIQDLLVQASDAVVKG
jgi:molecular chaperone HtpG